MIEYQFLRNSRIIPDINNTVTLLVRMPYEPKLTICPILTQRSTNIIDVQLILRLSTQVSISLQILKNSVASPRSVISLEVK